MHQQRLLGWSFALSTSAQFPSTSNHFTGRPIIIFPRYDNKMPFKSLIIVSHVLYASIILFCQRTRQINCCKLFAFLFNAEKRLLVCVWMATAKGGTQLGKTLKKICKPALVFTQKYQSRQEIPQRVGILIYILAWCRQAGRQANRQIGEQEQSQATHCTHSFFGVMNCAIIQQSSWDMKIIHAWYVNYESEVINCFNFLLYQLFFI